MNVTLLATYVTRRLRYMWSEIRVV